MGGRSGIAKGLGLLLLAGGLGSCTALNTPARNDNGLRVRGAGATFPAPLYQRWFTHLLVREGLAISYEAGGSGAGLAQLEAGLVDFAGSDRPDPSGPWVQIPMTGGAIALAYNHPGCQLQLKPQQVRKIFAGTIRNYSQLGCAPRSIGVTVRSDDSGTTANLLNFLGLSPRDWHTGTARGVVGNDGMATALAQNPGGFGYLETVFLHGRSNLQPVAIQNANGQFVQPTRSEVNRALEHIDHPQAGYPIVSLSWVMAPQKGLGPKAAVLRQALAFGLSDQGQLEATELGYGAMPAGLLKGARSELERIQP